VAETEQYQRVKVEHVPEVSIAGTAVADIIHLVAELVDNATAFSPPRSLVHVNATLVAKGVVIEVEDQGLGMDAEARDRANATMVVPPDFDAMAARGDSRLGLFVIARLAARNGIDVEFRTSPYGGTRAIVLVHSRVLASTDDAPLQLGAQSSRTDLVAAGAGRHNGNQVHGLADRLGSDEYVQFDGPRHRAGTLRTAMPMVESSGGDLVDEPHSAFDAEIEVLWPTEDNSGPVDEAPQASSEGLPRLPQRRPQSHLVAQLRNETADDVSDAEMSGPEGEDIGSADEVRNRMSAFQQGSVEGRRAGLDIDQ
jgi:hypothetical protein